MCKLATSNLQIFQVTDLEINRGGPSYTIDTVRALKRMGMPEVNWLIGADQLPALPHWRDAEALLREATIHVMGRPQYDIDWDKLPQSLSDLRRNVIGIPLEEISSTDIRERVAAGLPIDELVPPAVVEYIQTHALYRDAI